MSDPATTPTPAIATVGVTLNDYAAIAESLGAVAVAINPAIGGAVAAITGITELIKNTIIPAIQKSHDAQMDVATQAQVMADAALLRAKVGAPAATIN